MYKKITITSILSGTALTIIAMFPTLFPPQIIQFRYPISVLWVVIENLLPISVTSWFLTSTVFLILTSALIGLVIYVTWRLKSVLTPRH